jgi:hypothetical protein
LHPLYLQQTPFEVLPLIYLEETVQMAIDVHRTPLLLDCTAMKVNPPFLTVNIALLAVNLPLQRTPLLLDCTAMKVNPPCSLSF